MQFLEKDIEKYFVEYGFCDVHHGLEFYLVDNQVKLPSGSIIDVLMKTAHHPDDLPILGVGEIKKDKITASSLTQLLGYIDEINKIMDYENFQKGVYGFLIAPDIDEDVKDAICALDEKIVFLQVKHSFEFNICTYNFNKETLEKVKCPKFKKEFVNLIKKD